MAQYSQYVIYSKDPIVQQAWENLQKANAGLAKTPKSYAVRVCGGGGATDVQAGLPRGTVPSVKNPETGKLETGCLYEPREESRNRGGIWVTEMEASPISNPNYKKTKEFADMMAKALKDTEKKQSQKAKDAKESIANMEAENRLLAKGVRNVTFDEIEREKKIMEREADQEKNKGLIPGKKKLDKPKGGKRAQGKKPGKPKGR